MKMALDFEILNTMDYGFFFLSEEIYVSNDSLCALNEKNEHNYMQYR